MQIVWCGSGPPQGDVYGSSHEACNECHTLVSQENDFVSSPPLQLSKF